MRVSTGTGGKVIGERDGASPARGRSGVFGTAGVGLGTDAAADATADVTTGVAADVARGVAAGFAPGLASGVPNN